MEYPIRVLILDTVMDRGGAEAMTMNYYRNMDRSKVTYDFLVHRDYKAAYEDEIESLGGKIYRICPPYPQNWIQYQKTIQNLFREHSEYQIIHCNMMELGFPAYVAAKKCNVPVRICHAHTAPNKEKLTVKSVIRGIYKKLMLSSITHKFACGRNAAEWVFGKGNIQDVVYMKNAVDAERFRYSSQIEDEIRDEFNIKGKFIVGHVGRFFEPKNHPFIVKIFSEIAKKDPDAILMLVGGGELDDAIMNETKKKFEDLGLSDRVIFTGVRSDVNRIIQAFDVFILPSLCEGFPVVMVEAQAAGLKCLISDKVPPECDITGNVEVVPLESGAAFWAERILSYKNSYKKKDMYDVIEKAGYDIKSNAEWLENYYIEELKKCKQ